MSKSMQHHLASMMESDASGYGEEPQSCCVRSCSAANCRHNSDGARCTLEVVTINDSGGCSEYEAAADDFHDPDRDEATIAGISTMIPELPDHPSSTHNMVGKYMPDVNR